MEKVTQTIATTFPNESDWEIVRLDLNWEGLIIHIDVKSNVGTRRSKEYIGIDARDKMRTLKKANLSIKSLDKRIYEFLVADGVIEGTITGSPD